MREPYGRSLRLLGIDSLPAGEAGLRLTVRRHVCRVPFENVSKLLLFGREGSARFVTLDEFLDGIERYDFGGTCHANNPFLVELLREAGYDAELIGADMSRPNVHTCVRVRMGSACYHVDAGYGGPFREPIRLDQLPHELIDGADRYVLDRAHDGDGYTMSVFSGGEEGPGYVAHDPPRSREFFRESMEGSFRPIATFMNHLRICRIYEDHSVVLLDRTLQVHRGGGKTETRELQNRAEFAMAIANDLAMPRCPWEPALKVLEQVTGRSFFG